MGIHGLIFLAEIFSLSHGVVTKLPDGSFTASGVGSDGHSPTYSRIGGEISGKPHGWAAKEIGDEIIVDLTTTRLVTGVATQGRGDHDDQWVTRYVVETSENGYDWVSQGDFTGNFDRDTICRRRFELPVLASFVKFTVLKYSGHPTLRLDVLVYNVK